MDVHTEKSRLLNILNGQSVDRPSVICPGGMMNAAVTEVVEPIIKSRGGRETTIFIPKTWSKRQDVFMTKLVLKTMVSHFV